MGASGGANVIISHSLDRLSLTFVKGKPTGIHWQVAQQATMQNIVIEMPKTRRQSHQGIFMENGSGGSYTTRTCKDADQFTQDSSAI